MTELKACPFCGSDCLEMYRRYGVYRVSCTMCSVDVELDYNEDRVIRMWNRRVSE